MQIVTMFAFAPDADHLWQRMLEHIFRLFGRSTKNFRSLAAATSPAKFATLLRQAEESLLK